LSDLKAVSSTECYGKSENLELGKNSIMIKNKKLANILSCLIITVCSAHALEFKRTEETSAQPVKRHKFIPNTLVFAENQLPYTLKENLLHRWPDRPLFSDADLRKQAVPLKSNCLRNIEIAKSYGLNGLASLDHFGLYYRHLKFLEEAKAKGYSDLYVLPANRKYDDKEVVKSIREALKSPYTTKVNGKLLVWNYGGQENDRAMKFAEVMNKYPDLKDKLLIFGDVPFIKLYHAYGKHKGKVPKAIVEEFKCATRKVLNVCDGMILWEKEHYLDYSGDYPYQIVSTPIFRKYILPAVMKIVSKPEYKNKMLGLYARHGYINKFSGSAFGEYGTKGFRTYMDEAMLYNPDVIVLFEWNEANENTYFQPSVANGRSLERILNYYLQLMRHENFKPRPGDNQAIPNLIYTARRNIRTGETLYLEILNIPDQNASAQFNAQLILKNGKGKVVAQFPNETFNRNKFLAMTYRLPSEQFASEEILVPEIIVTEKGKKQVFKAFNYTKLHATSCLDFKSTRHPLREMLTPEKYSFDVTSKGNGKYIAKVDFKTNEKLASLEILCNGSELYAFDNSSEWNKSKFAVFTGRLTSLSCSPSQNGEIRIDKSTGWKVRNAFLPYEALEIKKREKNSHKIRSIFKGSRSSFILGVPLKELKDAVLNIDYEKAGSCSIKLAELFKTGNYSKNLTGGVRLDLKRADKLPDIVPSIKKDSVSLETMLRTDVPVPSFQLRAITENGNIFRSMPITFAPDDKVLTDKVIYSNYRHQPVKVKFPGKYIPDLKYKFDPEFGAILPCSQGTRWNISLGGGFDYGDPMWHNPSIIKKDNVSPAPQWISRNGKDMLKFNGNGDYMVIPPGAIPRSSRFTLEFEILPESNDDQVLLRSKNLGRSSGLDLVISGGELRGIYHGIYHKAVIYNTGLKINYGEWNNIRVMKDFDTIVFMVNGKRKAFPYNRRGVRPTPYTFGSNTTPGPGIPAKCASFKGLLRSFSILHDITITDKSSAKFTCEFVPGKNDVPRGWSLNLASCFKPVGKFVVINDKGRNGVEITPKGTLAAIFSAQKIPCAPGDVIKITAEISGTGNVQTGIYMYGTKGEWRGEISKWIKVSNVPQELTNDFTVKSEFKDKTDVAKVAIVLGSNKGSTIKISNLSYEKIARKK
jgi:hypothetical protein